MDPVETILNIPLFSGLSRHELARIAGFLEEQTFAAGEVIFNEGDPGDALYVGASGIVEILSNGRGRASETLALLGPRECFGEMGLFTGAPRSATARAAVPSVLFKLDKPSWDRLLKQYPSITLYFCQTLSQRLSDADSHMARDRDVLNSALADFVESQATRVKEILLKGSALRRLDPHALAQCFGLEETAAVLEQMYSAYPSLIRRGEDGDYTFSHSFRVFLYGKLKEEVAPEELAEIHDRCAAYFSDTAAWRDVVDQHVHSHHWDDARAVLHDHVGDIVSTGSAQEILGWLDRMEEDFPTARRHLESLRAEILIHLKQFDAAIRCYEELSHDSESEDEDQLGSYYQRLARVHQEAGNHAEALGYLDDGLEAMVSRGLEERVLEPMRSVSRLHQSRRNPDAAVRWKQKSLDILRRLNLPTKAPRHKTILGLLLSVIVGPLVWNLPPPTALTAEAIHFLATMAIAVILWVTECFDEYVVAIALLLSWLFLDLVPSQIALGGFGSSSWFFVLGMFGIAAAVSRAGLLYRVTLRIIELVPPNYKRYTAILATSGLFATAIIPTAKARIAMIMPLCEEISETFGFPPRSNGSAGLALSAFVGFGVMTFISLTGATATLLGWNLLPPLQREEFSWATWFLAALPAGFVTLSVLIGGILFLFPVQESSLRRPPAATVETQLGVLGPLTQKEWMCLVILTLTVSGFLFGSSLGLKQPWVALAGMLAFILLGGLDKEGLKRGVDWTCLIFFGVVSGLSEILVHLHIDRWLETSLGPILSDLFIDPLIFLLLVAFFVLVVRFLLSSLTTILLLLIVFTPFAEDQGVHPGVLLITIAVAVNAWFFSYQFTSYQIAYFSSEGKAFSHDQARKLMLVKVLATLIAITVSVPYWRFLGFIR